MKTTHLVIALFAAAAATACGEMDMEYGTPSYAEPGPDHIPERAPRPMAAPAETGEIFEDYGTNPVVEASEDNLVTFSVDVDTGSYTLMRDDIKNGRLPLAASVRVEEYVNFFDYGYAPPADLQNPFAVHLEAAPSPFGPGKHLLRVGLKGYDVPNEERPAANIVFLVDVSGSMSAANKLPLVQYSLRRLTETLRPQDTITIVTYAGADRVALPPTPVSSRRTIIAAINAMHSGGSTHGAAGIRTAYDLAEEAARQNPGAINRVILCTDGDFNVGVTGDALIALIDDYRERGVSLSVMGFGRGNFNDRDMERLADHGNGNYAFIDNEGEAERVLVTNLSGTLLTIAKDVKIQVELDPEVVANHRLIGYENRDIADEDFRNDAVDAGEIGAGHSVTAFIEVEFHGEVLPEAHDWAKVNLRYQDPAAGDEVIEFAETISTDDIRETFEAASDAYRFGAAVAEFAEILRASPHSEGRPLGTVAEIADGARRPDVPAMDELVQLVNRAITLPSR